VTVLNGASDADSPANGPAVAQWSPDADDLSAAAGTGTATDRIGDWDNEILYAGYRYDPATGLYHVRHRAYDVDLGWLQRDPALDGLNLYAYGQGGPLSGNDPTGCVWESEVIYRKDEAWKAWGLLQSALAAAKSAQASGNPAAIAAARSALQSAYDTYRWWVNDATAYLAQWTHEAGWWQNTSTTSYQVFALPLPDRVGDVKVTLAQAQATLAAATAVSEAAGERLTAVETAIGTDSVSSAQAVMTALEYLPVIGNVAAGINAGVYLLRGKGEEAFGHGQALLLGAMSKFGKFGKPVGGGSKANFAPSKPGWNLGGPKSATKWSNQMAKRGWTPQQIDEAIAGGQKFSAPNNINPGNSATRYVHPQTGRSVVVDDVTNEVLHVGGDGFKY
jgi:RHS repeat-associated protein